MDRCFITRICLSLIGSIFLINQGDDEEITPGYKTPKQVDLKTLQELDADDEALVKYKEALLGQTEDVLGKH